MLQYANTAMVFFTQLSIESYVFCNDCSGLYVSKTEIFDVMHNSLHEFNASHLAIKVAILKTYVLLADKKK